MKRLQRAFALLLGLALCLALLPAAADAADGPAYRVPGISGDEFPYFMRPEAQGEIAAASLNAADALANAGPQDIVASGDCGDQGNNVSWALYGDGGLVISGSGAMAGFSWAGSPWFAWQNVILSVTVEAGVTAIGLYAFQGCEHVTAVSLPEGLTTIDNFAFYDCTALAGITLPNSLTRISHYAFYHCASLQSIALPAAVTLGDYAFNSCSSLMSFSVSDSSPYYSAVDGVLFNKARTTLLCLPAGRSGVYAVPNGVTAIGSGALSGPGLTGVVLPDGLLSIGGWAFDYCVNLTSIRLPDSVTSIGSNAFRGCTGLTGVKLPAGLTQLREYAFFGCGSLAVVSIPEGLTAIGGWAFHECTALRSVLFGGTAAQRSAREGAGWSTTQNAALFGAVWHYELAQPDYDGVLPADLTVIGEEALSGCSFTAVRIPDGAESIGARAFAGSPGLAFVYIPESVTSIAADAFGQAAPTILGRAGSAADAFAHAHRFAFIAE